jgi:hypothetical protein
MVGATERIDGENTTLYAACIHARSVDGRHHPSRTDHWLETSGWTFNFLFFPINFIIS